MQFPSALIFWLILFLLLMLEFSERCGTIVLLQFVFLYILRSDNLISGLPKSNKRLFREDKPQIKAVEIYLWLTWVCRRKVLCDQLDELTFKQLFFFFLIFLFDERFCHIVRKFKMSDFSFGILQIPINCSFGILFIIFGG